MSEFYNSVMGSIVNSSTDSMQDVQSTIHIPPLKVVTPTSPAHRPQTLEPSARLDMDGVTAKLTSRQMALAEAKTIEDLKSGELDASESTTAKTQDDKQIDAMAEHYKKRRKLAHQERLLDFVHLPKPQPKLEEVNKKPFRPIAVLHQLHEPPPSAALFPPITPSLEEQIPQTSSLYKQDGDPIDPLPSESQQKHSNAPKKPRNYTRPRRAWTDQETKDLVRGVAICGPGRWKDILHHPQFKFQEFRTHVDLKDRFRTLFPQHQPERWSKSESGNTKASKSNMQYARRNPGPGQRAVYRAWTDQEDVELEKGFRKYGFQWNLIAKDESLHFDSRSAGQIRDRFRRRHPDKYMDPAQSHAVQQDKSAIVENPHPSTKAPTLWSSHAFQLDDHSARQELSKQERQSFHASVPKPVPNFPSEFLNRDGFAEESEFARSLAALDNDLKLPPLQWDDMAVQPIFDLG